jgi:hypothetical protein
MSWSPHGGVAMHVDVTLEQVMSYPSETARLVGARCACALLATLSLNCTAAQNYPKEGNYDYIACWSGTSNVVEVSSANNASTTAFAGNTRSNPPGGPFDMLAFTCVGMNATTNGKVSSSYYCQAADKDGDKLMAHGTSDGVKTITDAYGGTGKYEGLVRNGTSESLGVFPTPKAGAFTGCNRQTGTYKMK